MSILEAISPTSRKLLKRAKRPPRGYPATTAEGLIDLEPYAVRVLDLINRSQTTGCDGAKLHEACQELRTAICLNRDLRAFRKGAKR